MSAVLSRVGVGCIRMNLLSYDKQERPITLAEYIIENKATVRAAAKHFGISKSTVHKDITEKLPRVSPTLYPAVREILEINKRERHIRGGLATKHKYEQQGRRPCTQCLPPTVENNELR